jgi:hypothetical protein
MQHPKKTRFLSGLFLVDFVDSADLLKKKPGPKWPGFLVIKGNTSLFQLI